MAAYAGDLNRVVQLVEKGCSVLQTSSKGSSALHWASRGGSLEVVQWLVKAGCDANSCNQDGRSPVYFAADGCHAEVIEYLASKCNAQVNAHDRIDGQTPLHRYSKRFVPCENRMCNNNIGYIPSDLSACECMPGVWIETLYNSCALIYCVCPFVQAE
jgi:hypothetical protein